MRGVRVHVGLELLSLAATARQITTGLDLMRRNLCEEKTVPRPMGGRGNRAARQMVAGSPRTVVKIRADTEGESV